MPDRPPQTFLLSPAYCAGRRALILLKPDAAFPLARQLQEGQLALADAFTFMSGLYFRGKIAYARAFGRAEEPGTQSTWIITPTRGLLRPDHPVTAEMLREFASVDVDAGDARYRQPLERDLDVLTATLPVSARVILLGSVATGKYVDVLSTRLGDRLHYPSAFVGRGDMSRGGLLLRSVAAATELDYAVIEPATPRRGPRPPKLEPNRR